jgi:hypothetical protein
VLCNDVVDFINCRKTETKLNSGTELMFLTKQGQKNLFGWRVTLLDLVESRGLLILDPAFILLPYGEEPHGIPVDSLLLIDVVLSDSRVFVVSPNSERVSVYREGKGTEVTPGENAPAESIPEDMNEKKGKLKRNSEPGSYG